MDRCVGVCWWSGIYSEKGLFANEEKKASFLEHRGDERLYFTKLFFFFHDGDLARHNTFTALLSLVQADCVSVPGGAWVCESNASKAKTPHK